MTMYSVDIENDDEICRDVLVDLLAITDNAKIEEAINIVIAYLSVPGEWENGKYDQV